MNYNYIEVSYTETKTLGTKCYATEAQESNKVIAGKEEYEIFEEVEIDGKLVLEQALLCDVYYPISHFEETSANSLTRSNCLKYIAKTYALFKDATQHFDYKRFLTVEEARTYLESTDNITPVVILDKEGMMYVYDNPTEATPAMELAWAALNDRGLTYDCKQKGEPIMLNIFESSSEPSLYEAV